MQIGENYLLSLNKKIKMQIILHRTKRKREYGNQVIYIFVVINVRCLMSCLQIM